MKNMNSSHPHKTFSIVSSNEEIQEEETPKKNSPWIARGLLAFAGLSSLGALDADTISFEHVSIVFSIAVYIWFCGKSGQVFGNERFSFDGPDLGKASLFVGFPLAGVTLLGLSISTISSLFYINQNTVVFDSLMLSFGLIGVAILMTQLSKRQRSLPAAS